MGAELRYPAIAMETLVLIPVVHERGNQCPFFGVLIVKLYEMLVLIWGPGFNFAFFGVKVLLFDF